MARHYIIPIFVPHFGCPHDCVFCNQKRITGLSTNVKPEEVESIIKEHLSTFKEASTIEVAFFGGSFTAIDLEIQKQLLEVPFKYKEKGIIQAIRLSTRPDAIDKEILSNLKKYGVDIIELGVQSLDDKVLQVSGRGHSAKDVYDAVSLIKEYDFKLGLQMMVGLPGDSLENNLYTCKEFIKLDPYCVRIYPTLVIKDTYLEKLYLEGKYKPLSLEEAIFISSIMLMEFNINNINVIRVGLQATDNIQLGKDVVAGPFHSAFRQFVDSNIYRTLFDKYLYSLNKSFEGQDLYIYTNGKNISTIAGQKSSNTEYFKLKFGFRDIKIYAKDLDLNLIEFQLGDFHDKIDLISLSESYLQNNKF